jgi:hypothetical protein
MKNYCALVANTEVTEIIVGDIDWVTENLQGDWHDLGLEPLTVAIGWTYDADTNTFTPPTPEEADDDSVA